MMNRSEIEEKLRLIKFCMKRRIPVEFDGAQYITEALQLRYRAIGAESGFYYSVELSDINRINSSITVGLNDVDWPTEGGGFKLETKTRNYRQESSQSVPINGDRGQAYR